MSPPCVVLGIVLALTVAACCGQQPFLYPPDVIYVVPRTFSGWICVDFDEDAPPLPREGKTLVVRPPHGGEIVKTSDKVPTTHNWIWFDDEPLRLTPSDEVEFGVAQPDDLGIMRSVSLMIDPKFERKCHFIGTVDQSDAAGNPPGFEGGLFTVRPVSAAERAALIALFEETDGPNWTHRVGWLGPSGTECKWHGVECEIDPKGPTTWVTKLSLGHNNLRGPMPESLAAFEHLETMSLPDEVTGQLPAPLVRRWLAGELEVFLRTARVTYITEIELERASASACDRYRIVLRVDGTASRFTERCRDRLTFFGGTGCEVKEGWIFEDEDYARLAHTIEQSSYFSLKPEYRDTTATEFEITRVTRNGKTHQVSDDGSAGPHDLWTIRQAISGLANGVHWQATRVQPSCP